jgi:hypothetical protein
LLNHLQRGNGGEKLGLGCEHEQSILFDGFLGAVSDQRSLPCRLAIASYLVDSVLLQSACMAVGETPCSNSISSHFSEKRHMRWENHHMPSLFVAKTTA